MYSTTIIRQFFLLYGTYTTLNKLSLWHRSFWITKYMYSLRVVCTLVGIGMCSTGTLTSLKSLMHHTNVNSIHVSHAV